jgi:hypothetical protein
MKNTGASSIVCFTILVLPVLLDEKYQYCIVTIPEIQYRIYTILDVPVSCIYNTGIPESLIYTQYRKLQYSSSSNTGNTSIVKHTILEAPVFFIQQYW